MRAWFTFETTAQCYVMGAALRAALEQCHVLVKGLVPHEFWYVVYCSEACT